MFRNMEYVYAVYKEMSFSRAAERLFISQPALSAMVKKVEKRIGSPIFDRSCSPIRLTGIGREYISCAEQIMDTENRFLQYLNQTESLAVGSLSIGANSVFASFLLPNYIFSFSKRHPGVQVSMSEGNTDELLKSLDAGALDIVLENYDLTDDAYDKKYLFTENLLLVVPKALLPDHKLERYQLDIHHPDCVPGLSSVPCVPLSAFADIPFLTLRTGNDTRYRFEKLCKRYRFHPDIRLELDQLTTSYQIACSGLGAVLISDTILQHTPPSHALYYFRLDEDITRRKVYFYFRRKRHITRAMEEFFRISSEEAQLHMLSNEPDV
ncbi:MAG: LysR family transcriptional regulator [Eubacteriales bacterium]|nr:LysR family transcriptional regulator [Eubacteriales bacterium]